MYDFIICLFIYSQFKLVCNDSVQVFGAGCVRLPVRRTREMGRETGNRTPPGAALKFAQCYGVVVLFFLFSLIFSLLLVLIFSLILPQIF